MLADDNNVLLPNCAPKTHTYTHTLTETKLKAVTLPTSQRLNMTHESLFQVPSIASLVSKRRPRHEINEGSVAC